MTESDTAETTEQTAAKEKPTAKKPRGILAGELAGQVLADGIYVLPGQGNSLAIETDAGIVLVDASGHTHAPGMIATLREHSDSAVHAIVYSHGHHGYNAAVDVWQQHNADRGDPPPRLIGHELVVKRTARYRETAELQTRMLAIQFNSRRDIPLEVLGQGLALHDLTETFSDTMTVVDGSRRVDLIWAPSEVDDALAVWLPNDSLLFGGAATPGFTIPNIGTPLRTQRFTIRWAETLDRLAGLGAERLVTEFGPLIEGDAVGHQLAETARALRWLRSEVVARMNAGMNEHEILADMTYPDELFDQPWMRPTYGAPDYIVRDLYREENGWWDRNPTTLHPAPPSAAADAIRSAITDPAAVLARARELAEAGETQLAMHVVDLLAIGTGDEPEVVEARRLKSELCETRAGEVAPFVSRSCYRSSARLLDRGHVSWTGLQ